MIRDPTLFGYVISERMAEKRLKTGVVRLNVEYPKCGQNRTSGSKLCEKQNVITTENKKRFPHAFDEMFPVERGRAYVSVYGYRHEFIGIELCIWDRYIYMYVSNEFKFY